MTGSAWWARPGVPWSRTWVLIFSSYSFWSLPIGDSVMGSSVERDQKLWEDKINPQVWDQGIPGRAHQAEPVIIVLRDPTRFPNWKQYPLKREAQEGLQPLIKKLLVPTSSPCNTPILSVKKKDRTWRMVQDLGIINEAVVTFHPTVLNPYVIVGEIHPMPSGLQS